MFYTSAVHLNPAKFLGSPVTVFLLKFEDLLASFVHPSVSEELRADVLQPNAADSLRPLARHRIHKGSLSDLAGLASVRRAKPALPDRIA